MTSLFSSVNIVIILGMMQVAKKVPFDDPNVLNGVRGLYILSNLIIMGIYYYIKIQIDKKKGAQPTPPPPIRSHSRGPTASSRKQDRS